jgi:imidazolonepropionase-like amidohydrolase
MRAIVNCALISGDGSPIIEDGLVLVEGAKISYAGASIMFDRNRYALIDASGHYAAPGIINGHTHGCVSGAPLFSSGSEPLAPKKVSSNIEQHIREGETSILNVDGFADPAVISSLRDEHGINLMTGIAHTPRCYDAARRIDGTGISYELENEMFFRADDPGHLVAAIGECGSGATLGGGVQDYRFIPDAFKKMYGVVLSERAAREIKEAVLGRSISVESYSEERLRDTIKRYGIDAPVTDVKNLICACVLPPLRASLESIYECADSARQAGMPIIIHTAAASAGTIGLLTRDAEGLNVIAAHSNHPSFTLEEALSFAETLKRRGATIDISTFDTLNTGDEEEIRYFIEFAKSGLVDTVSTDYGGGNYCSILSMLDMTVKAGAISLPHAIRLATYSPANALPELGRGRGLIAEGFVADIILLDRDDIKKVDLVMAGGKSIYSAERYSAEEEQLYH